MSALWAQASDADTTSPADQHDRPVLRGLPRLNPRLARVPFLLVLIALFGLGMTGLLMLNTTLQNQAFRVSTLHRQASELAYTQADMESQLDQQAAPQELARRASELGLRPNPYPAFVSLPSGKVVGDPRRVSGGEAPSLIVKTPAEQAAERAAAVARSKVLAERRAADAKEAADKARVRAAEDKARAAANKQAAVAKKAADKAAAKKAAEKKAAEKKAAEKKAAKRTAGRG